MVAHYLLAKPRGGIVTKASQCNDASRYNNDYHGYIQNKRHSEEILIHAERKAEYIALRQHTCTAKSIIKRNEKNIMARLGDEIMIKEPRKL